MCEYDSLADIYDVWSMTDPAYPPSHDFYVQFCCNTEGLVVELGVGTGRIAIDVARNGKCITGIDISSAMLERCRAQADLAGVSNRINLIQSDIRNFELPEKANLIIFPFRSIGHLLTLDDKRLALRRVYEQLVPGGRFVFDHYVFDEQWSRAHHGIARLMHGALDSHGDGLFIWDIYMYNFSTQMMQCYIAVERTDAEGDVVQRTYHPLSFSWISPEQMRTLVIEAGFEIETLYGDFAFGPFDESSNDQVWVVRRPT